MKPSFALHSQIASSGAAASAARSTKSSRSSSSTSEQKVYPFREYETVYVTRPDLDSQGSEAVVTRSSDVIERLQGVLLKVDNWGRRRLAYPIKSSARGGFVQLRYLGHSGLVSELERNLRLMDQVLRFHTVKVRENVDRESVAIDPDQLSYREIESTDAEQDYSVEERLGMSERRVQNDQEDDYSEYDDDGDFDERDTSSGE